MRYNETPNRFVAAYPMAPMTKSIRSYWVTGEWARTSKAGPLVARRTCARSSHFTNNFCLPGLKLGLRQGAGVEELLELPNLLDRIPAPGRTVIAR